MGGDTLCESCRREAGDTESEDLAYDCCDWCGTEGRVTCISDELLCASCRHDAISTDGTGQEDDSEVMDIYDGTHGELLLQVGHIVELKGLIQSPQLNGRAGQLLERQTQSGRWAVLLSNGGGKKLIKPFNLVAVGWSAGFAPSDPRDNDFVCGLCGGQCGYDDLQVCGDCMI